MGWTVHSDAWSVSQSRTRSLSLGLPLKRALIPFRPFLFELTLFAICA